MLIKAHEEGCIVAAILPKSKERHGDVNGVTPGPPGYPGAKPASGSSRDSQSLNVGPLPCAAEAGRLAVGMGAGAGAGRGATLSLRRPEKCCLRSWKCRWPGTQAAPSWHGTGTGARTAAPPAPSGGGLQAEPPSPSEQRDVAAARCHSCRGGEQKYFGCNFILLSCCASALIHSPSRAGFAE